MRIMGLVAAGLTLAGAAVAQTGPVAPGADVLPADQRHLAETPLVLTTVAAPNLCLEMGKEKSPTPGAQVALCAPRGAQKVWFEQLSSSGDSSQVKIRIGKLGCLVSPGASGTRATFGICNDTPAMETWTLREGRLMDPASRCLTLPSAANGVAVVTGACDDSAPGQQWRLEAMRAAINRSPEENRFDPSGLGEHFLVGFLPDTVEQLRPRFSIRTLTPAERSEVKALMAPFRKHKALDLEVRYYKGDFFRGERPDAVVIPWKTLARLGELAESGDRDAMRAVLEAYSLISITARGGQLSGWTEDDFPHASDPELAYYVSNRLSLIWAAHYWHRHGADRLAAKAFTGCDPPEKGGCMGYSFTLDPRPGSNVFEWIKTGNQKFAISVSGIAFKSASGVYAQRQARFIQALGPSDISDRDVIERASQAVFAEQTGQFALWDNVRLNRTIALDALQSGQELGMRQTLKARAEAADWRARFEAFMASPVEAQSWSIQQGLMSASDADLLRFAERHVVTDEDLSQRLCGAGRQGTAACQRSLQHIAARRAEYERYLADVRMRVAADQAERERQAATREQAQLERDRRLAATSRKPDFWDQLAGLAEGFAAAAEAGNEMVTVRTYDSAGNFIGTETMTRSRAMGLGAQTDD